MKKSKFERSLSKLANKLHDPELDFNSIMSDDESEIHGICCYLFYDGTSFSGVEAVLSWRGGIVDIVKLFNTFAIAPVDCFVDLGRAYMNNPHTIRKRCRMKFSSCRKHDSATVFVQILFLSNNYFVICSSAQ